MSDRESIQALTEGFELMLNYSRIIAMLPLEDWRNALSRAETLGPVLDPTLYREYIYSRKPDVLKKILDAAIVLKRAVVSVQDEAREIEGVSP